MSKRDLAEGTSDDDIRSEYDFSRGVRGKYADRVSDSHTPTYKSEFKRVFLSSTYKDLIQYREAAHRAIQQFGWFTEAMEGMPASDDRPKDRCLSLVKQSDIYIGVFAHRYGSVPSGDDRSITEQEYRCARANGIPCLVFIVDDSQPWVPKWIDRGGSGADRLNRLKEELKSQHHVALFRGEDSLASAISAGLARWTHDFLSSEILRLYQEGLKAEAEITPQVAVGIHRRMDLPPTDVRFLVVNSSDFPTSVKTVLDVELNGHFYQRPVPGHYAGEDTWNLPAYQGVDGHFSLETFILGPAGVSYDQFISGESKLDLIYRYSALTSLGNWRELGVGVRYRFDHRTEDWLAIP